MFVSIIADLCRIVNTPINDQYTKLDLPTGEIVGRLEKGIGVL